MTDLGIYHFDDAGEMRLDSLHPGATVEAVRDTIGWDVAVAPDLADDARRRPTTSSASSARSSTRAASTRSRSPLAAVRRLAAVSPS